MLDRLRSWLRPEPIETSYDDAATAFRERRADAIDRAAEEAEAVRAELADALEDLDEGLAALADVEDERAPVEDVLDNVVTRRRSLVDDLRLPEDPEALADAVEAFLEARSDVSRKEAAVLQQIDRPERYERAVERFQDAVDRLDGFVADEHEAVRTAERLDALVERRREAIEDVERLRRDLEEISVEEAEDALAEHRSTLEAFRDGDAMAEYERLRRELDDARERRDGVVADVNAAVAKTSRGLKKLIYRAEQGDLALDADVDLLEELRDGRTPAVLDRDPEDVAAAVGSVADAVTGEYVDGSDRDKLLQGLGELEDLPERAAAIDEIERETASLQQRLDEHDAPDREHELERRVEEAERELEERERERERIEEELAAAREAVEDAEERIAATLDEAVPGDVRLHDGHGD